MTSESLRALQRWLHARHGVVALTGAGISTASGIPEYRDERGDWKQAQPVMFQDFVRYARTRRRYWARSMVGWPRVRRASPNPGHEALAELQRAGPVGLIVTQNVDGLHEAAGSAPVIPLHGRLQSVICLDCGARSDRAELQQRLQALNPGWQAHPALEAPDGDAELIDAAYEDFVVADCEVCAGTLKPDVVFFGESVPRERVSAVYAALQEADGLLVAGSSLMVFSGYRFAKRAAELGVPVTIVNRGRTRADDLAALKLEAACEDALPRLAWGDETPRTRAGAG